MKNQMKIVLRNTINFHVTLKLFLIKVKSIQITLNKLVSC